VAGFSPLEGLIRALKEGEGLQLLARPLARRAGYAARSYRRSFYFGLSALFAVVIVVDAVAELLARDLKGQSLDFVVRHRLSSPKPDPRILIVDIDEASLATMADQYGRWPWPRSVLAEAIATLSDLGARAIALNVMLSDPDKDHPNDDRAFADVAAATRNVVYPLVRLNPKNDAISAVRVSAIPGVRQAAETAPDRTIAVLVPVFPGTHDKLGAVNLQPEADGVVRRYFPWLKEPGYLIPSMPLRTLEFGGYKPMMGARQEEQGYLLNWRNKRGDYRRVSFAEVFAAMNGRGTLDLSVFRGAIVIIGVSAPGIATVKATSASPVMEDNAILATAIDDLKNGTYLRRPPPWASAVVSLAFVILLARAFYLGVSEKSINRWFGLGQSALLLVTIGSASYTPYLIDLSDSFVIALAFFAIAKVHALVDRSTYRGVRTFAEVGSDSTRTKMIVIGFSTAHMRMEQVVQLRAQAERIFDVRNVFLLDNAFGDSNLFSDACHGWTYLVAFSPPEEVRRAGAGSVEIVSMDGTWVDLREMIKGAAGVGDLSIKLVDLSPDTLHDATMLSRMVGEQIITLAAEQLRVPGRS